MLFNDSSLIHMDFILARAQNNLWKQKLPVQDRLEDNMSLTGPAGAVKRDVTLWLTLIWKIKAVNSSWIRSSGPVCFSRLVFHHRSSAAEVDELWSVTPSPEDWRVLHADPETDVHCPSFSGPQNRCTDGRRLLTNSSINQLVDQHKIN